MKMNKVNIPKFIKTINKTSIHINMLKKDRAHALHRKYIIYTNDQLVQIKFPTKKQIKI